MRRTPFRALAALAVLATAAPLAACGSSNDSPDASGSPETVVFQEQFSDSESAEMEKLVAQFEADNPDITIKLVRDNDASYYDKLVTQISAGQGPDIVRLEPPKVAQYITSGWLVPVDDVLGDKSQYFENTIDAATSDGKTYAVPQDVSTLALYYRKDMFQDAGISAPPATWDELRSDVQKLTTGGKYGIGLFGGWGAYEFYPWLWQSGAEVLNDDGTQAVYNSPEAVSALQLWADLQKDGMPKGMATAGEDAVSGPFINGNIAMLTSGPYMAGALKSGGLTDDQWGVAPLPGDATTASVLGGMDVGILKNSKVQDGAKKFLTWLMSDDVQTTWDKDLGYVPVKKSLYATSDFSSDPVVSAFEPIIEASKSRPTIPAAADVDSALGEAVQAALSGAKTPQQALDDAVKKSNDAIASDG